MTAPLLEVVGLKKHYELRQPGLLMRRRVRLRAVDGISLSVAPGTTLGLVGESGCGKSTTARLVLGLTPATDGVMRFEGKPVSARQDAEWRRQRRRMQMVYQDPLGALDRRLPVGEQVVEPLVIHRIGDSAREQRARADELFAAVGLRSDLFDRYPHELSGGQRQRVVLARALILEPSLLVCDEPVSALDVSIQAQVINLLQDLQARLGVGYLFISHDLKVVRQVAHEVAVMYLGRIVEQAPADTLFGAPAHPYTQALISAIPTPRRRTRDRIILAGDPPNPTDVPAGCPFHPRCRYAMAVCRTTVPTLLEVDRGHLAACHLVSGPASASVTAAAA